MIQRTYIRVREEAQVKKLKGDSTIFSRFESAYCEESSTKTNESSAESEEFEFDIMKGTNSVVIYCFNMTKNKENIEPLQFWKNHRSEFPFLSKYARRTFSIPGTAANVLEGILKTWLGFKSATNKPKTRRGA